MSTINRLHILDLWHKCEVRPAHLASMLNVAKKIIQYKQEYYDPAEQAMGVPWYVIGALDCREEDFNHHSYLGNGDPLYRKTTHVPAGRGPFATWAAGAADALRMNGWNISANGHWDIVTALIKCEFYNGLGYAYRGLPSPYVWGLTNQQKAGKYVADGRFSSTTWDTQPGCAGMFKVLKTEFGVDLNEA